jgi:probable F420-dependent oxidoreductase
MEFGVLLPTLGHHASQEAIRQLATTAENCDFDAVWAGDHVTFPAEIPDEYPFSPTGESPFHISQNAYDLFGVLNYLAGITDDVEIGSSTCIVPYRHPVVLARNALTVEALSDGRFDFGVGTGWMHTEFEVLDVPFEERGNRTDEFLELFEQLREDGSLSFDGPHHSFQETGFHPIPERGRPKIWIGGRSGAAFRRIGQFGDGWTIFWDRPADIATARKRIMRAWEDFDCAGIPEIALTRPIQLGSDPDLNTSRPLVGEPASVLEDIDTYADAGVTRIVLDFFTTDIDAQLDQIRRFGDEIIGMQ